MNRYEPHNWMPAVTFIIFLSLSVASGYYLMKCDKWDENCCSPIASLTAKACDLLHEWALGSKSTLLK